MSKFVKAAVVFGGPSPEHEVSLASARNVLTALDCDRYQVSSFGILKDGRWVEGDDSLAHLVSQSNQELLPVGMEDLVSSVPSEFTINESKLPPLSLVNVDVVFPVLHGALGEDGGIQGLFETLNLPYVGCGVFASAICMDKIACKNVLAENDIPQARWVEVLSPDQEICEKQILENLGGFPVFVKPANAGSSVGISKAKSFSELEEAIDFAARFDSRVLIEEAIVGREVELAVLGYRNLEVSEVCAEILPKRDFYDYEAKYHDNSTSIVLPADISFDVLTRLQELALRAFKAMDCSGLSRIDFFYDQENDKIYLNEINTMPGFTKISQYPRLMTYGGKTDSELIIKLIDCAFERHKDRKKRSLT